MNLATERDRIRMKRDGAHKERIRDLHLRVMRWVWLLLGWDWFWGFWGFVELMVLILRLSEGERLMAEFFELKKTMEEEGENEREGLESESDR